MRDLTRPPVLITTYVRLEHLKRTITSLRSNILAEQTDIFIASDFQKTIPDADKVAAVRSYLKSIDGFKSVTVIERDRNFGAAENESSALKVLFGKYEQVIVMEEDIVTATGFLTFMNAAFERYGTDERVFSIVGYCPPIDIPDSYQYDAFFLGRMSAWGCGFIRDRYESILEITQKEFDEFAANKDLSQAFVDAGGNDLMVMLKNVAYGSLEALDVQCMYTQFIKNQVTVYPARSLVFNIGFDGTGIHCGKSNRFDVALSDKTTFLFPDEPVVDDRIVRANRLFRNGN